LVQTILDQSHLSPVNLSLQAVYWNHDHALRLYPMPSAVRERMTATDHFD
jgi:DNA polymerase epsilon subunit 2